MPSGAPQRSVFCEIMGSVVVSGEGCGLAGLVSDLRSELAQVKRELSVLVEENKSLKEFIEKFQRSGVDEVGSVGGDEWKVVRSKGHTMKLSRKASSTESVPCKNTFSILSVLQDEGDDEVEVIEGETPEVSQPKGKRNVKLVGDSLCRHLGTKIKNKVSGNFYFPGGGVEQVAERLEGIVDRNSIMCLVVGGNDVHRRRSEEMVRRYKEALHKIRNKGGKAVACGILPRMGHRREWMSRAIGFNCRMETYCRENNIAFVDVWDNFYGQGHLYARDGVHLSRAGTSVLAGLIDKAVMGFR